MLVYRISRQQYINDLSGTGASSYPGRWNSKGTYVLYTAATPSLALLETVVHLSAIVTSGYSLATIFVPDNLFHSVDIDELPTDWAVYPAPEQLKLIGNNFIQQNLSLCCRLPSAIMPEEYNYLINPAHVDFYKVKIQSVRNLIIDNRLVSKFG